MKRIIAIGLTLVMALCLTGCSSDLGSKIAENVLNGALEGAMNAPVNVGSDPDFFLEYPPENAIPFILDAIGPDMVARAQEAGITIDISYTGYTSGEVLVEFEMRSPVSSTWPENTVDWEAMRAIQYAVLDLGLFGLSDAELALFKDNYYTPSSHNCDIDTISGVNIHINETPSYEAIVYIRHNDYHSITGNFAWNVGWEWGDD